MTGKHINILFISLTDGIVFMLFECFGFLNKIIYNYVKFGCHKCLKEVSYNNTGPFFILAVNWLCNKMVFGNLPKK